MGTKQKMQENNRPKPEIVGKSLESAEIKVKAWIFGLDPSILGRIFKEINFF